jgi:hypothetical protein
MFTYDKEIGVAIEETTDDNLIPGNTIWLRVDLDERHKDDADYRKAQKRHLIQRWINAAQYVLIRHSSLRLSWPVIIETDGYFELKSDIA